MKVTVQLNGGYAITLSAPSGFKVLVDDEVLLEHSGDNVAQVAQGCCGKLGGCCDVGYKRESLFDKKANEDLPDYVTYDHDGGLYIHYDVPDSSFIQSIRWWENEACLGYNGLEVVFKNGEVASYLEVPYELVVQWIENVIDGGSAGRFFNTYIKGSFEVYQEEE